MNGKKEFSKYLNNKIRSLGGIDLSGKGDAISMYQILNISGLDYKGQMSSGFGEKGIQVDASIKVDFLDFFAPGIPALELSAEAKAKATVTKETLVVLQRFPGRVYSSRISHLPFTTQLPSPIWDTSTPITLLTLDGGSINLEFGITATAGYQAPLSVDELGLGLSLSAQTKISGKSIRLKDRYPGSYPSPSDTNLAKASALQSAVDKLLGGQSKADLKVEVEAWIEAMFQEWLKEIESSSPPDAKTKATRLKSLKELMKGKIYTVKEQLKETAIDELATEIETTLDKYIFSKINTAFNAPVIGDKLRKWTTSSTKSKDLLLRLTELNSTISNLKFEDNPNRDELIQGQKAVLAQLNTYINLLQRFDRKVKDNTNDSGTNGKSDRTPKNYLSYFNLFSFAGGIGVDAKAGVSGGIKKQLGDKPDVPGEEYLPDPEVSLSYTGEINGMAGGEAQVMSYRFQSYGYDGGAPMVYTQDTWITYRRIEASATAMGELGFTAPEYEQQQQKTAGANLSYYSMTYQSIGRYWLHPIMGADKALVQPGNGSGLCFGISVSSQRLIDCAKTPNNQKNQKLLKSIARQLRVSLSVAQEFVVNYAPIADIAPLQDGFPEQVFLESSFAFPEGTRITLNKKSTKIGKQTIGYYDPEDGFKDAQIKQFRTKLETDSSKTVNNPITQNPTPEPTLEAIRLRFRIADFDSSTEPLFQLGFPVLKSSLDIDISKARAAGQEALFDYHVQWYNNKEYNTNPGLFTEAQERSVPPVVLLHQ